MDEGRSRKPHYIESAMHTLRLKKDRSGTTDKQRTLFQPLKRYTENLSRPYVSGIWLTGKWRKFAVKTRQVSHFYLRTFVFVSCVFIEKHTARVGGRDSSVGIATTLQAGRSGDRIPVGGEIFRTRPDRPCGPPSILYDGYGVFTGGKTAGVWR